MKMSPAFFTVLKVNKSNLWREQWCMTGNYCGTDQECCKSLLTKQPCSPLVSNTQTISIKENKVTLSRTQSFILHWEVKINWQLKLF